jgi:hypothetical protein
MSDRGERVGKGGTGWDTASSSFRFHCTQLPFRCFPPLAGGRTTFTTSLMMFKRDIKRVGLECPTGNRGVGVFDSDSKLSVEIACGV